MRLDVMQRYTTIEDSDGHEGIAITEAKRKGAVDDGHMVQNEVLSLTNKMVSSSELIATMVSKFSYLNQH